MILMVKLWLIVIDGYYDWWLKNYQNTLNFLNEHVAKSAPIAFTYRC